MMGEFIVRRYRAEDREAWDEFVAASRNATFLFKRDYMDYHADRFHDCSWMAYKGSRLIAILPANIDAESNLYSHQGLSYGGWILPPAHLDGSDLLDLFEIAVKEWRQLGIKKLLYKPLPFIYAERPSQEDLYALFRLGATIKETNLSMTIDLRSPGQYNKLRQRKLNATHELIHSVEEMEDPEEVMQLVADCLEERHSTSPVHSVSEMRLLKSRFPGQIRFFGIRVREGSTSAERINDTRGKSPLAAAVCIYDTGLVAHAQYIATSAKGREGDYLTPLFTYLIREEFCGRRYFDFGISNENHGLILNAGLLRQKASFGATGSATNVFELRICE